MADEHDDLQHDDIDTGPRISELADLRVDPPDSVLHRIRAGIRRRLFASDALDLTVPVFLRTLFEYLTMAFSLVDGSRSDRSRRPDGGS